MRQLRFFLVLALMLLVGFATHDFTPQTVEAARTWPVLRQGDSNENVVTLQYMLRHRGYSLSVDGAFGPGTDSAVRSFQQANGLTVDGIVGTNTWEKVATTVRRGDNNVVVTALQRQLKNKYNYSLTIDGVFGAGTESALKSFQSSRGLLADGIAGLDSWAALTSGTSGGGGGGSGTVNYNGYNVSDAAVRQKLQEIANYFSCTVTLTSGDRNYVPPGGSTTSLHLYGRAADFYVNCKGLRDSFDQIRYSGLLNSGGPWEFIYHIGQPGCIPAHLHLGHDYNSTDFFIESCGNYQRVGP